MEHEIRKELSDLKIQVECLSDNLNKHEDTLTTLQATSQETRDAIVTMKDILETWNNTKGFVKTVSLIGNTIKWLALIGAAVVSLLYFLKSGSFK